MKKAILSALIAVGTSIAVSPVQAQTQAENFLINSTQGASITGAATVSSLNTFTSSAAVQVTYPNGIYALGATVSPTVVGALNDNTTPAQITQIEVAPVAPGLQNVGTTTAATMEAAVAAFIDPTGGAAFADKVSAIRAWRSSGLD